MLPDRICIKYNSTQPIISHYRDINGNKYQLRGVIKQDSSVFKFANESWYSQTGYTILTTDDWLNIFDNSNLYFYEKLNYTEIKVKHFLKINYHFIYI